MTDQQTERTTHRLKGYGKTAVRFVTEVYIRFTVAVLFAWALLLAFLGIDAVAYTTGESARPFVLSEWFESIPPLASDLFAYMTLWMFAFFIFGALVLALTEPHETGESNGQ